MITKTRKAGALLLAAMLYLMPVVHAQTPPDDPGDDPDVPVSDGLYLLLAAGVLYVVKKGYDKRKVAVYEEGMAE